MSNQAGSVDPPLVQEGFLFSTSHVPDALRRAYEATAYRVLDPRGTFLLQVGKPSQQLAAVCERHRIDCAAFITAWNPYSNLHDTPANSRAQEMLEQDVRSLGHNVIPGIGEDPDRKWEGEPSVLALGMSRGQTERLGRKYRQNAVIWTGHDWIPELILLR